MSVAGSPLLVRTDSGVAMTLHTSGLAAGDAVTVWIIFNHPEKCTAGTPPFRCGEPDRRSSVATVSKTREARTSTSSFVTTALRSPG